MKSLYLTVLLAGVVSGVAQPAFAAPDFSGVWLPDASRASPWPAALPLTPAARTQMAAFDPATRDPTKFCMPYGTPRNVLAANAPLEIVQTPARLTMLIESDLSNVETRRVYLDGRALPSEPDPSWFGTSVGRWEGNTLVIETVGIETDVILSESGLPHSESLRVTERLSVVQDAARGRVLVDELTLTDPDAYLQPLKTKRYFTWAPNALVRESRCTERLWIDKLWRDRLEEHAKEARERGAKP
jgi:hypothetical protein